jgi:hypothetical protein
MDLDTSGGGLAATESLELAAVEFAMLKKSFPNKVQL